MPTATRLLRRLSLLVAFPWILATGCDTSPNPLEPGIAPPAHIAVVPEDLVLLERDSVALTAVVTDSAGDVLRSYLVEWRSTQPRVAKVSAAGVVLAHGIGSTRIVARAGAAACTTAVAVEALFESVSAGASHTCAVSTGHNAYCWGEGALGRRGDGTDRARSSPGLVYGEYTYRGVSAGLGTTCGFGGTQALCWGNNGSGQLGHGDKGDAWTPISVAPLDPLGFGVVAVNTRHACGVTADAGTAYCWGSDFAGQLGDGGHPSSQLPTPVAGGLAFSSVDVGMWFSCGVTQEGHAYCWGLSDKGQLGTAALTDVCGDVRYTEQPCSKEPVRAAEGLMVSALTTGSAHVCALTPDGVAYCWGDNAAGQLGDGTTTSSTRPVRVQSERRFVSIAGGDRHTCALTADGTAYCWGSNVHDQLGAVGAFDRCGGWSCSLTPSRVAGGLRFRSIAAARGPGGAHTCGVTESDLAYCWGSNDRGQLGTGFQGGTSPEPALVVGQPVSRDSGVAHAVFGTAANAHDRSCQTPE